MPEIIYLSNKIDKPEFPDQWYGLAQEDHFWMEARLRAFLKQTKDLKIAGREQLKGLEIGCGNGILRQQLEKNVSWIIEGADINEAALIQNPPLKGATYYYDILDQRPEFKNSYDFIILFDVLEHISQEGPFLEAIKFHLKKGGYLFINVPALMVCYSKYDTFAGHFRRYNKRTMNQVLASAGLAAADMRYWGMSMLPLLMLRKAFLSTKNSTEDVIVNGFKPPHPALNSALKKITAIELAICSKPFLGTSLLAAARKV
jgi:2-polyprenyl-3-methyl-5-hydroxy-6-metoxy-1,4-benzoquinol methylase